MNFLKKIVQFLGMIAIGFLMTGTNNVTAKKVTNNNVITIKRQNVRKKDATTTIQAAINKVAAHGGGKVTIAAGTYHVKYLNLTSNLNLHLCNGARIIFSNQFATFPAIKTRYEGTETKMRHPDVYGNNVHHVQITGNGTLDGNGQAWWKMYQQAKSGPLKGKSVTPYQYSRPYLIAFDHSSEIKITGIKLINSPTWTIHPLECNDVLIQSVTIDNPLDSPNTDGIDPESSQNVKILNNSISDGDDCIAIKSGTEKTAQKSPSQDIIISNNIMKHGHGGVVFGSEMSGGIANVVISNNVFDHTDRGIRMKTRRGRGGQIENITVTNTIMQSVITPIAINAYYGKSGSVSANYLTSEKQPFNESTPCIKNITISNTFASDVSAVAGFIYGLPESPVSGLTITNYSVTMQPNAIAKAPEMIEQSQKYADAGFWLENTANIKMNNVTLQGSNTGMFSHNQNNPGLNIK